MRHPISAPLLLVICTVHGALTPATAAPDPTTVAVVANANIDASVGLALAYEAMRDLPPGQLCLLDLPEAITMDLDEFQSRLLDPLEACLAPTGALDRLESVVLMRGVPLRVSVPTDAGAQRVSTAAALATGQSVLSPSGRPLLGEAPGQQGNCGGNRCLAARWVNGGAGVAWRPWLVTMLHGRSYEDAALLIESAEQAEADPPEPGEGRFVFMNGADRARGVLDAEYDAVIAGLRDRGFEDVERVPFDRDWLDPSERPLMGFFTGTAGLGEAIEGNAFAPGSIVDNLTSFGAVPQNFEAEGESQVSIARWVARGVGGVHGTTDEPLNNCFPSRRLALSYVDGASLAEAYFEAMPFAYWRNLVIGDPLLAPYAQRPEVHITGVEPDEQVEGPRRITVEAVDPLGRSIDWVALFVEGEEVGSLNGDRLSLCRALPAGEAIHVMAVAQVAGGPDAPWPPRGWARLTVASDGVEGPCEDPMPDMGLPDAGPVDAEMAIVDAEPPDAALDDLGPPDSMLRPEPDGAPFSPPSEGSEDSGGCACAQGTIGGSDSGLVWMLLLIYSGWSQRRWRAR